MDVVGRMYPLGTLFAVRSAPIRLRGRKAGSVIASRAGAVVAAALPRYLTVQYCIPSSRRQKCRVAVQRHGVHEVMDAL